jgi:Ala-tRNA(Pro) deacylase
MPQDFSRKIIQILDLNKANYRFFEHEEVLTYEQAAEITKRFGIQGDELKCLLVCNKKSSRFYLAITLASKRADLDKLALIVGETNLKMASSENVGLVAKAVPGCVSPFGFSDEITIVVNPEIFESKYLIFSGGAATNSIEIEGLDLKKVFEYLPNPVIFETL